MPLYIKISPFDLVAAVEVSHLHRALAVFLHGLIRDAHRCCVIPMDVSGRLQMSHFRQRKPSDPDHSA